MLAAAKLFSTEPCPNNRTTEPYPDIRASALKQTLQPNSESIKYKKHNDILFPSLCNEKLIT
jgi:hypothetical protein